MTGTPHIKDGFFFSENGERISVNIIGAIVRREAVRLRDLRRLPN